MSHKHINYHEGVKADGRITIFTPPGEFDADVVGDVYDARLMMTDKALIIEVKKPAPVYFATNPKFRDDILEGKKEIWVSHLNTRLGYILDQCRLDFSKSLEVPA
jgi:hypothetical protein